MHRKFRRYINIFIIISFKAAIIYDNAYIYPKVATVYYLRAMSFLLQRQIVIQILFIIIKKLAALMAFLFILFLNFVICIHTGKKNWHEILI